MVKGILYRSARLTTLNIFGVLLLFVTNNFLVRLLGESIYGNYVIINVWLQFFSVIVLFGMDDLFIATLPKYYFDDLMKQKAPLIFYWAVKVCIIVFVVLSALFLVASTAGLLNPVLVEHRLLFLLLLFALSILLLLIAFLRSIDMVVYGQVVDKIARPGLILLVMATLVLLRVKINLPVVLGLQILVLLGCIAGIIVLFRKTVWLSGFRSFTFDRSLKKNLTFLGISLLYMLSVRLDIMFLSETAQPEQVGYYNIAARVSDLVGYPLTAINLIAPTLLSKEFHRNKSRVLPLAKNIVLIAVFCTAFGICVVLVFGKAILGLFGKNFQAGFWPMIVLSLVHLPAAVALPLNTVLMISNRQHTAFACLLVNAVVTLCMCTILVPRHGSLGAAIAVLGGNLAYLISLSLVAGAYRYKLLS